MYYHGNHMYTSMHDSVIVCIFVISVEYIDNYHRVLLNAEYSKRGVSSD